MDPFTVAEWTNVSQPISFVLYPGPLTASFDFILDKKYARRHADTQTRRF